MVATSDKKNLTVDTLKNAVKAASRQLTETEVRRAVEQQLSKLRG